MAALAADPLGRGEAGRADHHADLGIAGIPGERRDAEVGEHGLAVVGDQDVARLDVAVQHAGRVGAGQRADQAGAELGCLPGRQRAVLGDDPVQRAGLTSSITIQGLPFSSTTSNTVTTPGWLSLAAVRASRSVRW